MQQLLLACSRGTVGLQPKHRLCGSRCKCQGKQKQEMSCCRKRFVVCAMLLTEYLRELQTGSARASGCIPTAYAIAIMQHGF